MTLVELLVAGMLGLMLIAMTMGATLANQRIYELDLGRTRLNQNIRSALDIVGSDIRQSGERLPMGFPAIEVINGSDGAPDEIILRRNLADEVMVLCQAITSGTSVSTLYLTSGAAGASPACVYGGQSTAYNTWSDFRTAEGGTTDAYIFDFATDQGEFLEVTGEADSGSSMYLQITTKSFENDYAVDTTAIYLISQWHYSLDTLGSQTDIMQVTENNHTDNPLNVIYGVSDFQVKVILNDDTELESFTAANNWTLIKALEVTISGRDKVRKHEVSTVLSARFFPRNILSQ